MNNTLYPNHMEEYNNNYSDEDENESQSSDPSESRNDLQSEVDKQSKLTVAVDKIPCVDINTKSIQPIPDTDTLFLSDILFDIDDMQKKELILDLAALFFNVFIEIEKREKVSMECYKKARDVIFYLNQELFNEVEDKRFHPMSNIMWHNVCNMSVGQSQKMIKEYLMDKITLNYILPLEEKLENVTNMKEFMKDFIRKFAIEMAPEIRNTWRQINIIIDQIPENEQLNSVVCVIS
jgi:hypothetical protein